MLRSLLLILSITFIMPVNAAGKIEWLGKTYDFGTFDEDLGNVSCDIKFVNAGDSDVVITNVRPTCGCTASKYTQTAVAPGDTGVITLTYNPKGRPGKFSKDVIVNANVEPARNVITITGNVIGASNTIRSKYPKSIGALKMNSFTGYVGELAKGKGRNIFLGGYNQSNDSLRVSALKVPSHIRVSCVPEVIPPGGLLTLSIYYNSSLKNDWGVVSDSFNLAVQPVGSDSIFKNSIETIAIIKEDFSKLTEKELESAPRVAITPDRVDFGSFQRNQGKIQKSFIITNYGEKPLVIRRIYTIDKGISVKIKNKQIKKGRKSEVTVTVEPSMIESDILNAKLNIISNDPNNSQASVRLVGEIK